MNNGTCMHHPLLNNRILIDRFLILYDSKKACDNEMTRPVSLFFSSWLYLCSFLRQRIGQISVQIGELRMPRFMSMSVSMSMLCLSKWVAIRSARSSKRHDWNGLCMSMYANFDSKRKIRPLLHRWNFNCSITVPCGPRTILWTRDLFDSAAVIPVVAKSIQDSLSLQ